MQLFTLVYGFSVLLLSSVHTQFACVFTSISINAVSQPCLWLEGWVLASVHTQVKLIPAHVTVAAS